MFEGGRVGSENCSRVPDAREVQLIASRLAAAFDFGDDPAIFLARILN
jgi:hypothetical protein